MTAKRSGKTAAECFSCPLPDCDEKNPRCPLSAAKEDGRIVYGGRVMSEDRREYHRNYSRSYGAKYRRVMLRGVKIRKCDIEVLRKAAEADGRTLEGEIVSLLESMAENARKRGV